MAKTIKFVYHVNGFDFEDTEVFGKARKEAKDLAEKTHSIITRSYTEVIEREQVFCNNNFFVGIKEATEAKVF